jgi:hypothetical protein
VVVELWFLFSINSDYLASTRLEKKGDEKTEKKKEKRKQKRKKKSKKNSEKTNTPASSSVGLFPLLFGTSALLLPSTVDAQLLSYHTIASTSLISS